MKMPIKTIKTFNPFNLQHGSVHGRHLKIQEVIDYSESRFRTVISYISAAPLDRQSWAQKLLRRELVSNYARFG
jgi:hypothetical protein